MLNSSRWVLAIVLLSWSAPARAQFTFASDAAANYGGGGEPAWTNGSSAGFGFGNWALTTTSGAAAIANPENGGVGGIGTEAFELSTTTTNAGAEAKAARSLSSAMLVGDTFSFEWGINQSAGGAGSKGFGLVAGGTSLVTVSVTNGAISLNGHATGLDAGTNAMTWAFHYVNATTLAVIATHAGGPTFSTNVSVAGAVTGFNWDAIQLPSGATHQSYYNNLLLTNSGVYATTETEGRALTGAGALVVSNNSTLTLTSDGNTFTGGTTIQSGSALHVGNGGSTGVLPGQVANNGTLVFNRSSALSYGGVISGSGSVTKTGTGSLTLGGNNTFSGVLTVAEGKLTINTINDASANGTLGNSDHAVVLGSSGQTGFLHYTGGKTGSTKRFTAATGGTAGIEVSNAATVLTLAGVIDGGGNVQKGGAGTLLLDAANTFTGALNVHDGTIEIETINNASANGTLGNSAHAVGLGKSGEANTATLLYTGTTNASTTKGFSLNSLTNAAGVISVSNAVSLTVSGAVTGAGRLEKSGAGTLVLSASNDYTGGTTLAAGVLQLNSIHAAGTGKITQSSGSSTLQLNTTGTVANAMDLYNIRTMQNVTLSGAKTLNNATYTVDPGVTTTEEGNLSGSGGITKQGTGTLIVTGANTYTGTVSVQAGVLNLNSTAPAAAAGATTNVVVSANAILLISQNSQVNDTASVSLSGGTIQRGSGVNETFGALTLGAASTLDFGTGTANSLNFGAYSGGGFKLNVSNFLQGNVLTFKTDLSGSINNTSLFGFDNGFTSNWNSGTTTFTITAIPEPSTYAAAAGLLALFLWPVRRRVIKDVKSILGLRPTGRERIEAYRKA